MEIANDPGGSAQAGNVEMVTIASKGNTSDFGTHSNTGENQNVPMASNEVRGLLFRGFNSYAGSPADSFANDDIDYITISSEGNSVDFGTCVQDGFSGAGVASRTRAIICGSTYYGGSPQATRANQALEYVTISTTGNGTDFGDFSGSFGNSGACGNGVRAVIAAGEFGSGDGATLSNSNIMEYVTIASTSNATDFGDLSVTRKLIDGVGNGTRGIFGGGQATGQSNIIDYITIASTGDASDFGDLTTARQNVGTAGDGHSGIQ